MSTPPMEEEDSSATSASSFAGSPQMSRMMADTTGNLDLNSYFLALANPDMSSASSDSQSQASRATSPSDWLNSLSAMDATSTAKWAVDADSLLTTGIDPNALILGSEQLTYDPALYPFSFEHGISNNVGMMTIPSHTPSQLQEQQQQQTQLHYMLQAISQAQASTPTQPSVAQVDSSSSTASYTPSTSTAVTQQVAAPSMTAQLPASTGNEADDVARRVRELAGITYAVTPAQQAEALRSQQLLQQQQQQQQQASQAQTQAQAFSIIQQNPALLSQQQLYPNSYPLPSQYQTSSPGPSSSASSPSAGGTTPPILDGGKGRTKTSHTTIERRYRTNLNERIIALRRAVPALRILERDKFPDERADERGYVDGVKAARKASKGSILGKAAEYIGVLKRRELRLRREYDGLKALITGLVGGPELFELWEREWRQRHPAGDDEDLAADDGDDEDGSEDEEEAKPRKKPKLATAPPPVAAPAPAPTQVFQATAAPSQPELKRKRGRPRKNPLPGAPATGVPLPFFPSAQVEQEIQQHQQDQLQPGGAKVLLGVFMLFSFLNPSTSPSLTPSTTSSSSSTTHKHVGTVLSAINHTLHSHPATKYVATSAPPLFESLSWATVIGYAHALVTIVLFLSLAKSFAGRDAWWARWVPSFYPVAPSSSHTSATASIASSRGARKNARHTRTPTSPATLSTAAVAHHNANLTAMLERDDRELLARVLRVEDVGILGAFSAVLGALGTWAKISVGSMIRLGGNSSSQRQRDARRAPVAAAQFDTAERAAVVRLAELDLMHRHESLSYIQRVYHTARLYVLLAPSPSSSTPTSSELATLAVLASPLSTSLAQTAWSRAQLVSSHSRLRDRKVLLDRPLADALALYEAGHAIVGAGEGSGGVGNGTNDGRITPLGLMASAFVCGELRERAGKVFAAEIPPTAMTGANGVNDGHEHEAAHTHMNGTSIPNGGSIAYAGEPPIAAARARLASANALSREPSTDSSSPVDETAEVPLEEVVMLGRSLTKPVRELTHLFEDVLAGIQPLSRGVSFILDHEGDDSDEEDEDEEDDDGYEEDSRYSGNSGKKRMERDALTDATAFLEAVLLYRKIVSAAALSAAAAMSSPSTPIATVPSSALSGSFSRASGPSTPVLSTSDDSDGPDTPWDSDEEDSASDEGSAGARTAMTDSTALPARPQFAFTNLALASKRLPGMGMVGGGGASVGSRLALRRMLGSRTFAAPVEIYDARDRMVDYLVDTAW